VTLVGYAQSNARVSTLMRNIENSPWLTAPELVEIKSVALDKQKINEFTLNLQLKLPAGAKPPGALPAGALPARAPGAPPAAAPAKGPKA
jgi:type IV pilus assembly protein PilN